jgi:hypothetical protein
MALLLRRVVFGGGAAVRLVVVKSRANGKYLQSFSGQGEGHLAPCGRGRLDKLKTALPALGCTCVLLGLITTRQKAQHTAISDAIAVTITATCVEHVSADQACC